MTSSANFGGLILTTDLPHSAYAARLPRRATVRTRITVAMKGVPNT
ncbi:hypothetical protein [Adhaeretor mobilis]|nr:hypothetical protein [Adhaeretor mobilis]